MGSFPKKGYFASYVKRMCVSGQGTEPIADHNQSSIDLMRSQTVQFNTGATGMLEVKLGVQRQARVEAEIR